MGGTGRGEAFRVGARAPLPRERRALPLTALAGLGSTSVEVSRAFIKPACVNRPPFVLVQHKQAPDVAGPQGRGKLRKLRAAGPVQVEVQVETPVAGGTTRTQL